MNFKYELISENFYAVTEKGITNEQFRVLREVARVLNVMYDRRADGVAVLASYANDEGGTHLDSLSNLFDTPIKDIIVNEGVEIVEDLDTYDFNATILEPYFEKTLAELIKDKVLSDDNFLSVSHTIVTTAPTHGFTVDSGVATINAQGKEDNYQVAGLIQVNK